jgi:2-polyprenyl-3-methyl-5-hydroxy-6-metoxy-1,4-benzoquinol methylase
MPDPDERIRRSWDANAGCWTAAVRDGALESRRLATDAAILAAALETGATRVLDVGCGEGWLCRRLADAGRDATGFDASRALIERAQEHAAASYVVLEYDAFASDPARIGTGFDLVVCSFSLLGERIHHVLDALRVVSKPDGHLLVQTLHPLTAARGSRYEDGWREEAFEGLPGDWTAMPWYFRTFGSWLRVLRAAGWQVHGAREPLHPDSGEPLSMILHARAS